MLTPVRALWTDPTDLGTADARGCHHCDDSCDYVVKDGHDLACVPHNEWFCTRLGQRVGIAAPQCAIVQLPDGALVFGSRWEGGITKTSWVDMVLNREIDYTTFRDVLTRVYAFDHFIHNTDRHIGNFIVREQMTGWAMLAMDYSNSWLANGRPTSLPPLPPTTTTVKISRFLRTTLGEYIDHTVLDDFINRLLIVRKYTIEDILRSQAPNWMTGSEKRAILSWWGSAAWRQRLEAIREGVKNGSYL